MWLDSCVTFGSLDRHYQSQEYLNKNRFYDKEKAVSYTHLDVYKRQLKECMTWILWTE